MSRRPSEPARASNIPALAEQGTQSRRDFCLQACQAASLIAVGTVLANCGGGSPTSPSGSSVPSLTTITGVQSGNVITLTVDSASPLASVGSAALVRGSAATVLVARTAQDAFSAFTSTCTHQTCTVSGYQSQTFVCPCHGSEFNTSGGVVRGPATRALTRYTTQFANNVLTITV